MKKQENKTKEVKQKANPKKTQNPDLHAKHRERMIEKYLNTRLESIPDHELLEILLFYSRPRVNTNEYAHQLLNEFGTFHGVFDASVDNIMTLNGLGKRSAVLIKLMRDCMIRYDVSRRKSIVRIDNADEAGVYFMNILHMAQNERTVLLLLDNSNTIIDCKLLDEGIVNYTPANNRKIITAICNQNAAGIYLAHNHPNGIAKPSPDDIDLTLHIRDLCSDLMIDFKDHIIVTDQNYCSVMDYIEKREF